jgi:hypothetical protein
VTSRRTGWVAACIVAATVVALHPVLGNGFLVVSFDDDAFILDNPFIRALTWDNVWACLTRFYHADYLPLPMLSYLLEFQVWGTQPAGYHLTNLLLHSANAVLVYAVARAALGSTRAAVMAGLLFALHPLQLEAVSVIAQRKTLLSTGFALGALLAYQRYRAGRWRWYVAALLLYVCACASKSSVTPFPLLLLLYDYTFRRSRWRIADKVPFLLVAAAAAWVSMASKLGTQVIKAPHGGSYLVTALAMSRVVWEYLDAMVLPLTLSPSYYYSPRDVFGALNWMAAAGLILAAVVLLRWRQRLPLTFFFVGWVVLGLLPVLNIVPIAVLRADRYLYLPMVGFAVWAGWGLADAGARSGRMAQYLAPAVARAPYVLLVLLAVLGWRYAFVWRSDVTAWTRTVERHPWNARAPYLLARAYANRQDLQEARRLAVASIRIDPTFERPYELLAELSPTARDEVMMVGAEPAPREASSNGTVAAGVRGRREP